MTDITTNKITTTNIDAQSKREETDERGINTMENSASIHIRLFIEKIIVKYFSANNLTFF